MATLIRLRLKHGELRVGAPGLHGADKLHTLETLLWHFKLLKQYEAIDPDLCHLVVYSPEVGGHEIRR